MHAGKIIGLAVEYWMDCRHVTSSKPGYDRPPASRPDQAMDVDEGTRKASEDGGKIFSVRIECESSPAQLYRSFRVSDSWISSRIEKPVSESTDANDLFSTAPLLDWLEPPQTYITSDTTAQPDALALDPALGKLPNVRFVAKLEPPLVVPLQTAMALLESVGVAIAQESMRATTYEGLLLRPESQRTPDPSAAISDISSERLVWAVDGNGEARRTRHVSSLFRPKVEYGRVLEEIPFTHPRQIVQILPVLRQFACLGELLRKSFPPAPAPAPAPAPEPEPGHLASQRQRRPDNVATASSNDTTPPSPTPPLTLADLLRPDGTRSKDGTATSTVNISTNTNTNTTTTTTTAANNNNVALDVTLSTSPLPALDLTFPLPTHATARATLHIRPNADVAVAAEPFVPRRARDDGGGAGVGMGGAHGDAHRGNDGVVGDEARRLARALDVAGDLNVWVEWVGRRYVSRCTSPSPPPPSQPST
ncbi:mediator of RNA polymerase II transcription subunit 1-domain-containing protein [Cryomyces antarcticus]